VINNKYLAIQTLHLEASNKKRQTVLKVWEESKIGRTFCK